MAYPVHRREWRRAGRASQEADPEENGIAENSVRSHSPRIGATRYPNPGSLRPVRRLNETKFLRSLNIPFRDRGRGHSRGFVGRFAPHANPWEAAPSNIHHAAASCPPRRQP
jgi:hypothetical protein